MSDLSVFEHSYYIGNYMSGILYGVELVMYFMTMKALSMPSNTIGGRRFFAIYSTLLVLLLTVDISCNAVWGEQMWITFRDTPGGVPVFVETQVSVWYQTLSSTSVVALIFLGDALLIHRLFLIWGSSYLVIVVPMLAYLTAFSLAIIVLVVVGKPGGNFFGGKAINFGTPYYAITISMNILITLLICLRLRYLSTSVGRVLGKDNAKMYTSISTMLIESAAPYTLVGIMFLIPYARGSQTSISFGQVWAKLSCLSPQLIVLRVVTGKAWKKDIVTQANSTMVFENDKAPGPSSSYGLSSHGTTLGSPSNDQWHEVNKAPTEV
ncbi:hypothetical protein BDQ12DRAFT_677854 [Crucibulum laeve]|uniref:Fungal pheromone mating factor STE2 GPCR-domain-containing protein n=1 Tax=Crucibulum laeve TaxID=68775 RepID=A0A5C3MBG0_9AGAR|nr:hypothetical protein BDQ12DRAFT_677854 [Crucibulum laeve]